MSWRFWTAWAIAVFLAFVLPVAIPFAVWPPREGRHTDLMAECSRRAAQNAATETPYIMLPLSSDVHFCERDEAGVLTYRADVEARGPYGIPYASGTVGYRDIRHLREHGGVTLGVAALFADAFAVSLPFALVFARSQLRQRPPVAA